mgnify:CR=1 FL=1
MADDKTAPRWRLADLYEELGVVLMTSDGDLACGPEWAERAVAAGRLTEAQGAVLAAADPLEAAEAKAIVGLRHAYETRVRQFRPVDAARARLSLFDAVMAGQFEYAFTDEPDPLEAARVAAAIVAAAPWFVTTEVCQLIEHAAPEMPAWTLSVDDLPANGGFIIWADVTEAPNTEDGVDVPYWVNATSFALLETNGERHVQFSDWEASAPTDGTPGWSWIASGTHSWWVGASVEDHGRIGVRPGTSETLFREQAERTRRRMACLWALAKTPRLIDSTELHPPRAEQRRAARQGITSPVTMYDVRPTERAQGPESTSVDWTHRWIVSGHWRQQAHGPGRSQRRPIWIAPHLKGPDDKPLVVKDRVGIVRGDSADAGDGASGA